MTTILAVDDNADDRELYKRTLTKSLWGDLRVVELSTGENILESIEKEKPTCVLLDYSLPGRNGLEVLKRIRVKMPNLPIIILTGQGNESVAVRAMKLGAQDYIIKSNITPDSLYHTMKIAIERCQMKQHIENQQSALKLFVRALAHDLKSPLQTIQSYLSLVRDEPQKNSDYLERISRAAENMGKIIMSVRSFTELTEDNKINLQTCDTNRVLKMALENLSALITESSAQILCVELPMVKASESHLLQVFQNLIGNAIQHSSKKNPLIQVNTEEFSDHYVISIKDDGCGIETDYMGDLFKPFKRFKQTTSSGSGLGLAICGKIIESHGGEIWYDQTNTTGAKFCFSLPKSDDTPPAEASNFSIRNTLQKSRNLQVANILLVDDNPDDQYIFKFSLSGENGIHCNLYPSNNGQEALDFLENSANPQVHLIILDINMPLVDGFEFLKIKSKNERLKKIPVIVCSSSDYEKDKATAKNLGALEYIVKPFSKHTFIDLTYKLGSFGLVDQDGVKFLCVKE